MFKIRKPDSKKRAQWTINSDLDLRKENHYKRIRYEEKKMTLLIRYG